MGSTLAREMKRGLALHRLSAVRHQYTLPAAGTLPGTTGSSLNRAVLPITDPAASLAFYQKLLGMQLISRIHHPGSTSFLLATLPSSSALPPMGLAEADTYAQTGGYGCALELLHLDDNSVSPVCTGVASVGFRVNQKWLEHAAGNGVQDTELTNQKMLLDPDGHQVHLSSTELDGGEGEGASSSMHQWTLKVNSVQESALFYERFFGLSIVQTSADSVVMSNLRCAPTTPTQSKLTIPGTDQASKQLATSLTGTLRLQECSDTARHFDDAGSFSPGLGFLLTDVLKTSQQLQKAGVTIRYDVPRDEDPERSRKDIKAIGTFDPKLPPPRGPARAPTATVVDPNGYQIKLMQRFKPQKKRVFGEPWFDGEFVDPGSPMIKGLTTGLPTMYRTLH